MQLLVSQPRLQLVAFACAERVFHPGLTNLFEPLGVICATAHPIKILRKERMICVLAMRES